MNAPIMDNRISLGNLLTVFVALISVATAWGFNTQRIIALEDRVRAVAERTEVIAQAADAARNAQDARLRPLEVSNARLETRLDTILQGVARIEARLERAESR